MDLRQYTQETLHQRGEAVNSTTRQVSPTALSYLQGKHKVSSQTVGAAINNEQALNMARTLAFLALLLASVGQVFALDPTSRISQYGHSVWRVQDGYFGGRVLDITQTTDSYLWAGTEAGLFKFDDVRFVRWTAQSGEELPSFRILSLLGARDGSLWIGTDAGLAHLVKNRLILYEKNERWWVSYIFEDRDGKIWIDHHRRPSSLRGPCVFPPLTRDLEIDYTALSFATRSDDIQWRHTSGHRRFAHRPRDRSTEVNCGRQFKLDLPQK